MIAKQKVCNKLLHAINNGKVWVNAYDLPSGEEIICENEPNVDDWKSRELSYELYFYFDFQDSLIEINFCDISGHQVRNIQGNIDKKDLELVEDLIFGHKANILQDTTPVDDRLAELLYEKVKNDCKYPDALLMMTS